jgi:hypothetical protein
VTCVPIARQRLGKHNSLVPYSEIKDSKRVNARRNNFCINILSFKSTHLSIHTLKSIYTITTILCLTFSVDDKYSTAILLTNYSPLLCTCSFMVEPLVDGR